MENKEKQAGQTERKPDSIRKEPVTEADKTAPALTNAMIESVKGIGPWVRFLSVIGFISVAFLIFAATLMLGISLFANNLGESPIPNGIIIAVSILYVIIAILYIFPSLYLWNTASAVIRIKKGNIVSGMETALSKQRSFWKFVGIMIITFLVMYPLFIIGILVFAAMGTLH